MAAGRLVPVMEGYDGSAIQVSADYLEGRSLPSKIRALIDFAVEDSRAAALL